MVGAAGNVGMVAGLGNGQQAISVAATGGLPVATAAVTGALTTGVSLSSLTVPIIGGAIAAVTAIIGIFMSNAAKYHAQESATTKVADTTSTLMKQNLDSWNASEKTVSEQQQCISNWTVLWNNLVTQCGQSSMADPGKRCVSERAPGGIYDMTASWLDPIRNDPNVKPDPVTDVLGRLIQTATGQEIDPSTGLPVEGSGKLLLIGLGVAAILLLMD